MVAQFTALGAMLSRAVDARLGETLRLIPQQRADNYGKPVGSADGRLQIDVIGTFIEGAMDLEFAAGDKRNSEFSSRVLRHDAMAWFDRGRFEPDQGPRKGDVIVTIDQPAPSRWRIVDVLADGASRLAMPLVRA